MGGTRAARGAMSDLELLACRLHEEESLNFGWAVDGWEELNESVRHAWLQLAVLEQRRREGVRGKNAA